jgi:hypothetical protein
LGLFVIECCLLALLGATAVWTKLRAAARRADLRRALREVGANLSGTVGASDVALDLEGARLSVRIVEEPGMREAIVIALELDRAREAGELPGYRGGTARVAGRPWIVIRPGLRWQSGGHREKLAPLFAGPRLPSALATLFDAGVDRVHVNDGAPTIAAVLRAPRPEHLNAFALREVARGLVAVAGALPAFDGPPRASTRLDASHVALVLTVALAVTAPFFPGVALHAWLPIAQVMGLGATGAVVGILAWIVCVCVASGFMRRWPSARRRTLGSLLALFIALPADGVGFAVALNALGPQEHDYTGAHLLSHWTTDEGWFWDVGLERPRLSYEGLITLPDDRVSAAMHCAGLPAVHIGHGWFGVRWFDCLYCPRGEPKPAPRVVRRSTEPIPGPFGFVHLGTIHEKPPLSQQYLDVHLHNDAASPRWFLLPETLGMSPGDSTSRASIRASRLTGFGSVIVVELQDAGLQAILLPASADVVLRGVVVSSVFRGGPPRRLNIEALALNDLLLGAHPLEAFFAEPPISSTTASVDDCRWDASCSRIDVLDLRDVGEGPFPLGFLGVERLPANAEYHVRSPFVE